MSLALIVAGIPIEKPPLKKGDQVTWNKDVKFDSYQEKYKKKWGEGPFTVVVAVFQKDNFHGYLKLKNSKGFYIYENMPRECCKDIPIGQLRKWQMPSRFQKVEENK